MLKWLKRVIWNWLKDIDGEKRVSISRELILREPLIKGGSLRVNAVRSSGLHLQCRSHDGFDVLVDVSEVQDPGHFLSLWRELGGSRMTWSDGTPLIRE